MAEHFALHHEHSTSLSYSSFTHYILAVNAAHNLRWIAAAFVFSMKIGDNHYHEKKTTKLWFLQKP
jgi:hypothetical protein